MNVIRSSRTPNDKDLTYRDHHINEVFYGESLTSLSRTSGNFECPLCASKMKTSRGILRHLSVQYEVKGGYDKKRQNAAEDMEDCEHVPPPPITMELEAKGKKPMTRTECILASSGSLAADPQTQSDKIMLTRLGRWTPLVYENGGQQLGLLTDEASASILLQKGGTFGTWSSPIDDPSTATTVRGNEADNHVQHIKNASKASRILASTRHEEITDEQLVVSGIADVIVDVILLAGAILVDGGVAVAINSGEPYSRDTVLDAHYERRNTESTTLPSTPGRYGYLSICLLSTTDGQKLVIGSRTANFLVTSSCRLDIVSVNLGPTTSHFVPSNKTALYIDNHSAELVKTMLMDSTTTRSQQTTTMYLLKQVRSKFYHLSTFTMSRSSSTLTSRLDLQPSSIWTLCNQEQNHATISLVKSASLLFRSIATRVLLDGKKGKLHLEDLDDIIPSTDTGTTIGNILRKIRGLFGDQRHNLIIGNLDLNAQLTDLANSISHKKVETHHDKSNTNGPSTITHIFTKVRHRQGHNEDETIV